MAPGGAENMVPDFGFPPSEPPEFFDESPATEPTRQTGDFEADFEAWWKAYPGRVGADGKARKAGKPKALIEFRKARKHASQEILLRTVKVYAKAENPKFVVDPERWLSRGRWADEVTEAPPSVQQAPATNWQL